MHVVFRESHGLEEAETPIGSRSNRLRRSRGACRFLTVTLGLLRQALHRANGKLPTLRLANLDRP